MELLSTIQWLQGPLDRSKLFQATPDVISNNNDIVYNGNWGPGQLPIAARVCSRIFCAFG
jgi:hypothetical protein